MAVIAGQGIEAAGGDVQLVGGLSGRQRVLLEGLENMPDERRAMTMLMLLIKGDYRRQRPNGQAFRQPPLRSGFLKAWPLGRWR